MEKYPPLIESNKIELLVPEFAEKLILLIEACEKDHLKVVTGCTLRGPAKQGEMWCRSRSVGEVLAKKKLIYNLSPPLSSFLSDSFCRLGPPMTHHLPGQSWHQWGEAADLCALVNDKAIWNGSTAVKIADAAEKVGLYHSVYEDTWMPSYRKWHVQLRKHETPLLIRDFCNNWTDLEREMAKRFTF